MAGDNPMLICCPQKLAGYPEYRRRAKYQTEHISTLGRIGFGGSPRCRVSLGAGGLTWDVEVEVI